MIGPQLVHFHTLGGMALISDCMRFLKYILNNAGGSKLKTCSSKVNTENIQYRVY